jgi:cytochrome c-type biogenesis protein CcmH/NrfF
MDNFIGPITNSMLDNVIKEIKKKKNKEKIMKNIIDPLLCDITNRYYPHFMTITIILIVMVILLITILIMIVVQK